MKKDQLVFATHNHNKIIEVQQMVNHGIEILGLHDIGCHEDIVENGKNLNENAHLKAEYVFSTYGINCFADDTGLEVEALQGAPGVYSARYAGEEKNSEANMQKLLQKLVGKENRKAQFRTVICYRTSTETYFFEGICKGEILQEKQGDKGFGYDPIFKPNEQKESFATMPSSLKNKISHRAIAFSKFYNFLLSK